MLNLFSKGKRPESDAIEVTLGARASFAGSLRSETSIRIDGAIEGGLIETPANVFITEGARVTCEIIARTVSIRGAFQGAIRADRVELLDGSRVSGIIHTGSLYRDDGAVVQAEVRLRGNALGNSTNKPPGAPGATPAQSQSARPDR